MRRFWTERERDILIEMYKDNYTKDICMILNRSIRSVYSQARLMGLGKSSEFKYKELKIQSERLKLVGVKNRFNPGTAPHNKNKPLSPEMYERLKPTMFKKGNEPSNTKYNGHERVSVDGYTEIRIQKGTYVLKHRYIWEQSHGQIPEGYILVFIDKNPQNITVENLELITRKENMLRNSIQRYPVELKSTIRLVKKLNRHINAKKQN